MSDPDPGGESFASIDLGGGATLVLNPETVKAMLHDPAVIAALTSAAEGMADVANSIAVEEGTDYAVTVVSDWPGSSRARANVWTKNAAARLDEAKNATLLKTLARFG